MVRDRMVEEVVDFGTGHGEGLASKHNGRSSSLLPLAQLVNEEDECW